MTRKSRPIVTAVARDRDAGSSNALSTAFKRGGVVVECDVRTLAAVAGVCLCFGAESTANSMTNVATTAMTKALRRRRTRAETRRRFAGDRRGRPAARSDIGTRYRRSVRNIAPMIVATLTLVSACSSGPRPRANESPVPSTSSTVSKQLARTRSPVAGTTSTTHVLADGAVAGATVVRSIVVSGVTRSYRLYTPARLDASRRIPLVIVLHGASGNAARVELRYHWDQLAATKQFFVVYPQGIDDHWNPYLVAGASDDVGFISALLNELLRMLPVDARRVYVAGMSNGGAMTYRLGCTLTSRLAAIAAVEAWNPGCTPAAAVALVAVHGLADEEVSFPRAQASVSSWRTFDHCSAASHTTQRGLVTTTVWPSCAAGTQVVLYAIAGSGHEWPGASPPLPGHDLPSNAIDATAAIWSFFSQQIR
jgi:polyhydroxybutyrate depolymerase